MQTVKSALFVLFLLACWGTVGCSEFTIPKAMVAKELTAFGMANTERHLRISTHLGVIELELYDDTPLHRGNILRLVKGGFYTSESSFYRVKENFMAQGGDPSRREPDFLVPAEFKAGHFHRRGALAAARRDDNPGMASNPADFYIVTGEGWDAAGLAELGIAPTAPRYAVYLKAGGYPYLDGKYTVFGQVTKGIEVVVAITRQRTRDEKPLAPILFTIEAF